MQGQTPVAETVPTPQSRIEALAALTGHFAHDFNNLLTVIRGSAELLERGAGDPEQHLAAIMDTADEAALLTSRLLAFARRLPLRPRAFALRAVLETLRDEVPDGITVRIMCARDLKPVMVDPDQLLNVLRSAVENAAEAMPEGGVLTFAAVNQTAPNGVPQIKLSIADTGVGMGVDVREQAFEPFFTTKPLGQGPGLGLSQIYGFAVQSGGTTELDSAPGRGTTLVLTLPAAEVVAEAAAQGSIAEGTRVLLVEDSNAVAAFAEALLADMGCAVVRAACAEEALERLHEAADGFDIMFSDIVMPGMNGLELAAKVRAERPALPILLATAHSEAAAEGGSVFPILAKPYRRDALATMMGSALAA
ncbi:response regulator [Sphingomonas sp. ID0503]|uniref:response regulator n=1 Tax=Sphingomonas sp. ID0503 TaxID=3399691 RepID=UPI003AFA5432